MYFKFIQKLCWILKNKYNAQLILVNKSCKLHINSNKHDMGIVIKIPQIELIIT